MILPAKINGNKKYIKLPEALAGQGEKPDAYNLTALIPLSPENSIYEVLEQLL